METKVMSFNIENASKALLPFSKNYWKDRNAQIKKALSTVLPDFICLNEATNLQLNDLDKYFCDKIGYKRFGEYTYYPILMSDCNAIYYNNKRFTILDRGSFWLSDNPSKKYSKMKSSKYWRNCNWMKVIDKYDEDNWFYLFATHTNGKEGGEEQQNILINEINKIVKPGERAIVCGDFNFFYDSGKLKTMSDYFDNAREIAGVGEEPTYHDRGESVVRCAIDYFFTKNFDTIKYGIFKYAGNMEYLSDHYPIMITF